MARSARFDSLTEAVIQQLGGDDDRDEVLDTLKDVGRGGADSGWSGFTYTSDCIDFYNKNKSEIWAALNEDADGQGLKGPMELIATFRRQPTDDDDLKELLAWYALERAATMVE